MLSNELRTLRKTFNYRSTDYNGHTLDDANSRFSEERIKAKAQYLEDGVAHLNDVDSDKF